jgi:hypothetical protein
VVSAMKLVRSADSSTSLNPENLSLVTTICMEN